MAEISAEALRGLEARIATIKLDIPALESLAQRESVAAPPPRPIRLRLNRPIESPPRPPAALIVQAPERRPPPPVAGTPAAPKRGHRGLRAACLLLAIAAALTPAALRRYRQIKLEVHQVFPLPYQATAALACDQESLYAVDPHRGVLFAMSAKTLEATQARKLPTPALDGLTRGADGFWSTETSAGLIRRHAADADLTVVQTFANEQSRPGAVYWDGTHLWAADQRTQTVYQYAVGQSLSPVNQYTLAGVAAAGLHVSENRLWVLDSAARRLTRYRLGGMLTADDYFDLSPWLSAQSRATGLAVNGDALWLAADNPPALHRFSLKLLSKIPNTLRQR